MKLLSSKFSKRSVAAFVLLALFLALCKLTWTTTTLEVLEHEVEPAWERMKWIRMWKLVLPNEETIIGGPRIIKKGPLVVIFVNSSPSSFERRETIRKTWAEKAHEKQVLVLFFVGTILNDSHVGERILKESRKYGDVVQDTLMEDYFQLPVKVLKMMKYYLNVFVENKRFSSGTPLFVKADDDVLVNLDNLMSPRTLKQLGYNEKTGTFEGKIVAGAKLIRPRPFRNSTAKHYIPYEVYGQSVYPSYVSGMFYTIGNGDLVKEIYERSLNLEYFPFEDIFITGIIANYLVRADIVNLSGVHMNLEKVRPDDFKEAVALHELKSPDSMMIMYSHINSS